MTRSPATAPAGRGRVCSTVIGRLIDPSAGCQATAAVAAAMSIPTKSP
jgi:hypothetical protein